MTGCMDGVGLVAQQFQEFQNAHDICKETLEGILVSIGTVYVCIVRH